MPLLGIVAEIKKFKRITKINLWSNLATRGRGVHLHTIVDRDAEGCKNADEGVVLVAIQIAVDSDLSTEERCLRVQHTCSPVTSPTP